VSTPSESKFVELVRSWLVSLPHDLKIAFDAMDDENLPRPVRELATGVVIHVVTPKDAAATNDAIAAFADDAVLLRLVIFPDVLQVVITEQKGNDARVTLIGPNDHHDNLHFKNQPQARMIFFEDTGGHADVWAEIMFLPADQPHTTRVHTRLYADVHGVASLVVSGGDVRRMRELKIERDLVHIREYFKRRASVVRL